MFSHKSTMTMVHKPYTALVNLEDMTVIDLDPRGKFADPGQLVSKCESLGYDNEQ